MWLWLWIVVIPVAVALAGMALVAEIVVRRGKSR